MPGIAKLGHIALVTPDLEESAWFFRDVIGLREVDRDENGPDGEATVYLRGVRDWEHHTLSLTRGARAEVDHVGWRTREPEDVAAFADRLEAEGTDVDWLDPGHETGQGEAVRFRIPPGHTFELYFDVEKPQAPDEVRSRLKNRVYSVGEGGPIMPRRIDHVNLHGDDVHATHDWLCDVLGFQLNEYVTDESGERRGGWLSTNPLVHTVAYGEDQHGGGRTLHHLAYYLDSLGDLMNAGDVIREHGVEVEGGPGKHGITQANFMYIRDPGSDHRIELFNGGYQVWDPDWEAIEWDPDEAAVGLTWFGSTPGQETTPFR